MISSHAIKLQIDKRQESKIESTLLHACEIARDKAPFRRRLSRGNVANYKTSRAVHRLCCVSLFCTQVTSNNTGCLVSYFDLIRIKDEKTLCFDAQELNSKTLELLTNP